ncbi:MAG TPA: hypothetical protein P5308_05195 [Syntrophales bacterium]|nr:hypothetical protein [Syntrophales bacterium]
MREWMAAQSGTFTSTQLCDGLDIPHGKERDKVRNALFDFLRRGEIARKTDKRKRRQHSCCYIYITQPDVISRGGQVQEKIFKAMRLLSFHEAFAVTDIQRMTGTDRNYIDKLTQRLVKAGYLKRDGYRSRSASYGREAVYRVVNTDRFRVEVMK